MSNCKKYTNTESAASTFRTRPKGECQSCTYFSSKNCGDHYRDSIYMNTRSIQTFNLY